MIKSCSVLIPNRYTWDAVCLTIESILKRTTYKNYKIIVCDNSMAKNNRACEPKPENQIEDNGNRLDYLRRQAKAGNISLVENRDQQRKYGHGENLKLLLKVCTTEFALLFISTAEILQGNWLNVLVDTIRDDKDLGVGRFRQVGTLDDGSLRTPVFWPNIMLLDMRKYREIQEDYDWDLDQIPYSEFEHKEIFGNMVFQKKNPLVFCDTGWRIWEKLTYKNSNGLRMKPLPEGFYREKIQLYGGIDRNSHRPEHPHVRQTLIKVRERLKVLREGI